MSSSEILTFFSSLQTALRFGKEITVVDTPGVLNADAQNNETEQLFKDALMLSPTGFHAVGFVISCGTFSHDMMRVFEAFFSFFGDDANAFAFIIFTFLDTLDDLKGFLGITDESSNCENAENNICAKENFIEQIRSIQEESILHKLIMKCAGNILIIDNKAQKKICEKQVESVIEEIERIKVKNLNACFGIWKQNKMLNDMNLVADRTSRIQFDDMNVHEPIRDNYTSAGKRL